jgi:hypothetical protein
MGFKCYYQWATLVLAVTVAAQTTTSCNPLKSMDYLMSFTRKPH